MLKESFPLPNSETKQNPVEESEHFFRKGNEQEKGLRKTYFNCFQYWRTEKVGSKRERIEEKQWNCRDGKD